MILELKNRLLKTVADPELLAVVQDAGYYQNQAWMYQKWNVDIEGGECERGAGSDTAAAAAGLGQAVGLGDQGSCKSFSRPQTISRELAESGFGLPAHTHSACTTCGGTPSSHGQAGGERGRAADRRENQEGAPGPPNGGGAAKLLSRRSSSNG
eukprot:s3900_g3.t1